jgi:hypothetical protein
VTEFDVAAELLSDVSETQFHNTVILVGSKEWFCFSALITEQAHRVLCRIDYCMFYGFVT